MGIVSNCYGAPGIVMVPQVLVPIVMVPQVLFPIVMVPQVNI